MVFGWAPASHLQDDAARPPPQPAEVARRAGRLARVHVHSASVRRLVSLLETVASERQLQASVVDTGHMASARRLVLLRLEAEGVHVDASGRHVGVVLVGLDKVEVSTITLRETVMTIQL